MTTKDKLTLFLRLAAKSKTNYGVAGLVALPVLCAWLPLLVDGRLLLNFGVPGTDGYAPGLLVNIHFETATVLACLAPVLGLLTSWFRSIAKGPLWPAVQAAGKALSVVIEQGQEEPDKKEQAPATDTTSAAPTPPQRGAA